MDWEKERKRIEEERLSNIKKLRKVLTKQQMDTLLEVAKVLRCFVTDYAENDFRIGDGQLPWELAKAKDNLEDAFHMTRGHYYTDAMFEREVNDEQ